MSIFPFSLPQLHRDYFRGVRHCSHPDPERGCEAERTAGGWTDQRPARHATHYGG
ncbi:hypothetical protein E2C01_085095 [Portunus trituberculatus]|uniref:Uncharacterized protein n=1 Tax=Portunus trituberculatus TaxID=210409 RepID=A0A5B7J5S4_PORTR|nr:hypothetical protein [Portunus trituberculatus]